MQKRKPLSKPVMIRMEQADHSDITAVAKSAGITTSDVIRLAVRNGLPSVRRNLKNLQPS